MDELENARLKRLSRQSSTTGWASDPQGVSTNPVKFWIYSCSLERGPRLIAQLGTDFYRDLVAGTGPFELLRKQFPEPGRDLPGMLGLFDIEAGDGPQDEILRMHLTMVLALWADYIGVEALEADPHAWFPATQREREEYKCAQQEEVVVISHVESWI